MAFIEINTEQKQHINLSEHAYSVIKNDMAALHIQTPSTFINKIISNFASIAKSSLSLSSDRYTKSNCSCFSPAPSKEEMIVLKQFEESYSSHIKHDFQDKKHTLKIHLNSTSCKLLFKTCTEELYYQNAGSYIKSLVEEYAQKPYFEREKIIAKDTFDTINKAIKYKKFLKLDSNGRKGIKVKPYKIATDNMAVYHYLIGYELMTKKTYKSFSCRISNIQNINNTQRSSFISIAKKKALDLEIQNKGPQFMSDDVTEFKIYLTDDGIRLYNRILYLRPNYTDVSKDKHIYTFKCSPSQIEYYFFKFGADAVILAPKDMHDKFLNMYKGTLNNYQNITP